MTDRHAEGEVREVLQAVLGRPIRAGENVARVTESSWDSLRHVEILLAVEGACRIRFDESEMGFLDNLDKLVASVERHRAP